LCVAVVADATSTISAHITRIAQLSNSGEQANTSIFGADDTARQSRRYAGNCIFMQGLPCSASDPESVMSIGITAEATIYVVLLKKDNGAWLAPSAVD